MRAKSATVAVVGGGIFGSVAALELARAGFSVTLLERAADIVTAASAINQYRLHRGYHYPRSPETISSCLHATPLFEDAFRDAVIAGCDHYYGIAKEGSFLSGAQYLEVLDKNGLPYTVEAPDHINPDMVELTIRAEEHLYDPQALRGLLWKSLEEHNVEVRLGVDVDVDQLDAYDFVIVATYAGLNETFKARKDAHREYQFEVCEKIVVSIPDMLRNVSTVIMDGPFMSFDPLGATGYAVMGHVEHAIHHSNVGYTPEVPDTLRPYLNSGIIKNPPVTKGSKFLEDGARFMPALHQAQHVGSMYTVRTVLPRVDRTDERPTLVRALDDRVFTIYSGKIGNSVQAAHDVVRMVEGRAA